MATQNPQQADNSMAAIWIIAAIFIFGAIVMWVFRYEIMSFILKVRVLELQLVGLFTDQFRPYQKEISEITAQNATYGLIWDISVRVGSILRFPIAVVLVIFSVIMYASSTALRYRTIFSMQKLVEAEQKNWPQITPVVKLDLVNQDIFTGKWAMAMTPMQFCKKYKLLVEEQEGGIFNPRVKRTATLIKDKAHSVFATQLGQPWRGYQKLRPHVKALFAVFAARANGDRETASKMLNQIALSTESGRLNFEGVDALANKYGNSPLVQRVMQSHAYELTVMGSMLTLARADGVLATADFLWLKPIDRPLWYMLNNMGRQTAFVEVAGPFAHWIVERELGRKLSVAMVDEAVKALETALNDVIYIPDNNTQQGHKG